MGDEARIAACIRALLAARGCDASICPSEVARGLWPQPQWRDAMPAVRNAAQQLAVDGIVLITQSDQVLDPARMIRGPIRLRRGPGWPADAARGTDTPP